ncbi:MAG: hypothetical protein WBA12_13200 [Catalinimonas sp.]
MFKRFLPHLIALGVMLLLAFAYTYPVLSGKTLVGTDIVQPQAWAKEAKDFREATGEQTHWINNMFSGMPAYMVYTKYPNNVVSYVSTLIYHTLPVPAMMILLLLLGGYLLMLALGGGPWLGLLGAVSFAFASYNVINIEAGHLTKVVAIAFAAPVVGGVILAFRGRYLAGAALLALCLTLEIYANHIQITYYTLIAVLLYGLYRLIVTVRTREWRAFLTAVGVLLVGALLAVGPHASRLVTTREYAKATIRGPSELTPPAGTERASGGLDRDYAFQWSYGVGETFTLLVPGARGGASGMAVGTGSNTYEALTQNNVPRPQADQFIQRLPLYWGNQPFTSGPAYAGALVVLLFVFAMLTLRHPVRWWLLGVTVLFMLIAWGKNAGWFADLWFYYVPLYNKFRAHTMVLSLVPIFMAAGAVLVLRDLLAGKIPTAVAQRNLIVSAASVGGLALLFGLLGGSILDFVGAGDGQMQLPGWLLEAIRDDRRAMLRRDAFRALLFVGLGAGLLWFYLQGRVKTEWLVAGLIALTTVDLWTVDRRFFDADDFTERQQADNFFRATAADQRVLQDTSHYRVLNTTVNVFNDATPSYFHKNVGGYHPAKLRRYQDLIERHISRNNRQVLNMLNVRYFIVAGEGGQPTVRRNSQAYGNAWFVRDYQLVPDADAEIAALDGTDLQRTAVVDERFAPQLEGVAPAYDPAATIELTEYAPNRLTYRTRADAPQLAVFSEIYYNQFDDWQVMVDGQPADHLRANYVLRAMPVPAGEHTITFEFVPQTYNALQPVDLIFSILLVAGLLGAAGYLVWRSLRRTPELQPA